MRTPLEMLGNASKNLLRGFGLLATFAAALAMAQQSTSPEDHTNARPHSSSGASTWGPTRNTTTSTSQRATPQSSSASSVREPYGVKQPSGSTRGAEIQQKASPIGHSSGTAGLTGKVAASSPAASSTSETPKIASSGGRHAPASQRKTSGKTHSRDLSSSMNRRKAHEIMGIHPPGKAGTHKGKKHKTL